MFKTPIKGEGQIVSEYRELSDKEKLHEAQQYMKSLRKQVSDLEDAAMRYRRLRKLEVVIMAKEGAEYLKEHDLDEYIDNLPMKNIGLRAQMIKELTPALNNLFGEEYAKYEAEHGEEFEKLASKEAVRNDKT
jgi:hypothetical protein